MPKRIQINRDLYDLMTGYIKDHYDKNDAARYQKIIFGIEEKQEAIVRHNAYTVYKNSQDPEMREAARQIYLDKAGIHPDFRR